jgi:hypothetical protein
MLSFEKERRVWGSPSLMSEKVDVGLISQVSHLSASVQVHYKFTMQKRQEAPFAYDGSMNSFTPPGGLYGSAG